MQMLFKRLFFIILSASFFLQTFASNPRDTLSVGHLELVKNCNQFPANVLFSAKMHGGSIFLEKKCLTVAFINPVQLTAFQEAKTDRKIVGNPQMDAFAYRVSFLNARNDASVQGEDIYNYHFNYFLGKNSDSWASNVPVFASVVYHSIYDGVDLKYYQKGDYLEYEFLVQPHSTIQNIRLQYDGLKSLSIIDGNLFLNASFSRVLEMKPIAYQINASGDTIYIACHYKLSGNVVSFVVDNYDTEFPLVIDPTVVFSSFSGSTADNWGYTATYDALGNLYGGGIAFGVGYPTTLGAYQVNFCNGSGSLLTDVAISKFDASGSFLHYSTYLGGSFVDIPHSLFVNDNNELYVFGTTGSNNFPVTSNAYDTSFNGGNNVTLSTDLTFPNGSDVFVAKFSANGSQLLSSTYIGGSGNDGINTASQLRKNYADDNRGEILVDENSDVYVVTSTLSTDFPTTAGAYHTQSYGGQDICVFKFSNDLSHLSWSSYFGGSASDAGYSMMLAADHSVYFCGGTTSDNLPVINGTFQSSHAGGVDGYVAHLSANGSSLLQCTYLGKSGYDQSYLIKGDRHDYPHVFGQTDASGNAWIHNANYHTSGAGQFLIKLNPTLTSDIWSTAFGSGYGGPDISPTALLVDYCNNIYMSGWGSYALNGFGGTSGLPITSDAFQSLTDGSDYYFICLSDDASSLVYGSFFGGSANYAQEHVDGGTSRFDRKGKIYQAVCAGCGGQSSFPTTNGAYATHNGSTNCNLGVIKMDFGLPIVVADFVMPNTICAPYDLTFANNSQTIGSSTSYYWNFGDGTTSTQISPTHHYAQTGLYQVTLIVQDNGSCNFADTLTKPLLVLSNSIDTLSPILICNGDAVQIGVVPSSGVSYLWTPASTLSSATISNPIATPDTSTMYMLIASSGVCVDTLLQQVNIEHLNVSMPSDTTICLGDTLQIGFVPDASSIIQSIVWSTSPSMNNPFGHGQTSISVHPTATTTYYVQLVGHQCTTIKSVTVHVSVMEITNAPDLLMCFEDSIALDVSHNGGANCQYVWSVGGSGDLLTDATPYVSPEGSTTYSVTITNAYGCSATATGHIIRRVGTFPVPLDAWCDTCEIQQNGHTHIYSTDYGADYTYHWTPDTWLESPNTPNTEAHPFLPTTYTISVTDTFGCVLTATVFIKVGELKCDEPFVFIPNAFTPNGDGINDVVFVRSEILDDFVFMIYSRWGQKVFETMDQKVGWDGTFDGKPCQAGVYDYYFKGTCIDQQKLELKGNITLVR